MEVSVYVRRLERLQHEIGIYPNNGQQNEEPEVDTSKMSPFERKRYDVMKRMATIREDIRVLEDMKRGGSQSVRERARVNNQIRRNMEAMKKAVQDMKGSVPEDKKDEFAEIRKHMQNTEKLKRQVDGIDVDLGEPSSGGAIPMKTLDQLGQGDLEENLLDPARDEEFQQFYVASQRRDQEIDQGLDRIYDGLVKLKQNAVDMQDELQRQDIALTQATERAHVLTSELQGMNKKLKKVLKDVDKDKYCCYLICFLLLIGILGVILTQANVF